MVTYYTWLVIYTSKKLANVPEAYRNAVAKNLRDRGLDTDGN